MRGKAASATLSDRGTGITPAGAGKRSDPTAGSSEQGDHPRRCGEKSGFCAWVCGNVGSPPQVRGKVFRGGVAIQTAGITPAGAGKSRGKAPVLTPHEDHPRRCGEKCLALMLPYRGLGSPPQVRGKALPLLRILQPAGITPAGAGKRRSGRQPAPAPTDHPRRCGEKARSVSGTAMKRGSPPQVRGKEVKTT